MCWENRVIILRWQAVFLGQNSFLPLYDSQIPEPELISFGSFCNPRREVCAAECNLHRSEIGQGNDSMALPVSFHAVRSRHAAETGWEEFSSTQICVTSLGLNFLVVYPVSDKDRHLLTFLQKLQAFSESWEDQVRTKISERLSLLLEAGKEPAFPNEISGNVFLLPWVLSPFRPPFTSYQLVVALNWV